MPKILYNSHKRMSNAQSGNSSDAFHVLELSVRVTVCSTKCLLALRRSQPCAECLDCWQCAQPQMPLHISARAIIEPNTTTTSGELRTRADWKIYSVFISLFRLPFSAS
jgi:hypothetical protein